MNLLVLVLVLVALAMIACGGKPAVEPKDGGDNATFDANKPVVDMSLPQGLGHIEVMARWLWPPPAYRRSLGRNSCGVARSPALSLEIMGGLSEVAVSASSGEAPGSATLSVSACGIHPRVVVVGTEQELHVQNLGEKPAQVIVQRLDSEGVAGDAEAFMPLRLPGQQYSVAVGSAGVLRLHNRSDPEDYSYAVVSKGAAVVTRAHGIAELRLTAGAHELTLWHPPVDGKPLRTSTSVEVQAQMRSKTTVDLSLEPN